MEPTQHNGTRHGMKKDDLIAIAGAGGFIGASLVKYFCSIGFTRIRAVDKKPLDQWYLRVPGVENLCLDCSTEENCRRVCEGAAEVYNLAADMGGMGFIERFRVECLRSVSDQHPHDRGRLPGRCPALFLFLLRLRLQHTAPARPESSRAEGEATPIPPWPSAVTAGRN